MQVLTRTRKSSTRKLELSTEVIDAIMGALSGTKYPQFVAFEDAPQETLGKAAGAARLVKEALAERDIPVKAYAVPESGKPDADKESPHWAGVGFPKDYAGAVAKLKASKASTNGTPPETDDEPDETPTPEPTQQPTSRKRS